MEAARRREGDWHRTNRLARDASRRVRLGSRLRGRAVDLFPGGQDLQGPGRGLRGAQGHARRGCREVDGSLSWLRRQGLRQFAPRMSPEEQGCAGMMRGHEASARCGSPPLGTPPRFEPSTKWRDGGICGRVCWLICTAVRRRRGWRVRLTTLKYVCKQSSTWAWTWYLHVHMHSCTCTCTCTRYMWLGLAQPHRSASRRERALFS